MRSRVRLAALLAGIAVVVAGCGSVQPPGTTAAGSPSGDTRSAVDAAPEAQAKGDVRITACEQSAYTPQVGLEVTNSTTEQYRYAVTITISNAAGKRTDAYFVRGRMQPGQTVTETIPGANPVRGQLTCTVSEAKRLPPK